MTETKTSASVAADWDKYWHGAREGAAYGNEGVNHPAISAFWQFYFGSAREKFNHPKIVDVASGTGAVLESAWKVYNSAELPEFYCLDTSVWAIHSIRRRFTQVSGYVSDARAIPLASATVDIATSQFGVEYAGLAAMDEMARLVVPGGQIALVLHHKDGSIYKECADGLEAVDKLIACRYIPLALKMFAAGFAISRGADPDEFKKAARELLPAFKSLEPVMDQYGVEVAGGLIAELYNEVARIQNRLQYHDEAEVLEWLKRMDVELQAYTGRLDSMCRSALDIRAFGRVCDNLTNKGYRLQMAESIKVSNEVLPLAWAIIAEKIVAKK